MSGDGGFRPEDDEPEVTVPGTGSLGSDVTAEDLLGDDEDSELLDEYGGDEVVSLDDPELGLTEPETVEEVLLESYSDDDDALGTESGGFGPDRPREFRTPRT